MKFGFAVPSSTDGEGLVRLAQRAEELGFESVWTGDHIVLPTEGTNQYPYTEDGSFSRGSDVPFLETMTLLSYIAARTSRIKVGSTVVILPYRNPIVQAKMFASLDVLTGGRVICGVGVGWLEKEFDTLGVSYADRGAMSDEFLEIFKKLWTEDHPVHNGRFYSFDGIQLYPKPVQKPHVPIWVGGHTKRAVRRTARFGNAWHPTRQTPDYVAGLLPYLREEAEKAERNVDDIVVSLKRSLHFTDIGLAEPDTIRTGGAVIAPTRQVIDDIHYCQDLGIHQLTYDFRSSGINECIRTLEHFAERVVPAV